MGRRKSGRRINGILVLDKASGITSNSALQRIRRLFDANKAGHTGSLDPLATGVLPICFGEATKFSQYLLNADKAYRVKARFGLRTHSCDVDGEVLQTEDATELNEALIKQAMQPLTGSIEQVPPMVSALKHQGKRLYELARQGIEVEREARPVNIFSFELLEFIPGPQAEAVFEVSCSKGTYIRSLISDLGEALGCGATVAELRRIHSGKFAESDCYSETQLTDIFEQGGLNALDELLQPMEGLVEHFPQVDLDSATANFFMQGQAVILPQTYRFGREADIVRVFRVQDSGNRLFLGAGELVDGGTGQSEVQPKRLRADVQSELLS